MRGVSFVPIEGYWIGKWESIGIAKGDQPKISLKRPAPDRKEHINMFEDRIFIKYPSKVRLLYR